MGTLLTLNPLHTIDNSQTKTAPAIAVADFSGESYYYLAWKGPNSTDTIRLAGFGAASEVPGATTNVSPALAILNVYLATVLYIAWKDAANHNVHVMRYVLGGDGAGPFPGSWTTLPTTEGKPNNPAASTDTSPALAIGANNDLYMVWKTPGTSASLAWSVYDGTGWSTPAPVPEAVTDTNPAVAAYDSPGWPLCIAWKGASTDGVFWTQFTPASSPVFTPRQSVSGASTDAAPALATGMDVDGLAQKNFVVIWKGKGSQSMYCATLEGQTAGETLTLPRVQTSTGPAACADLILAWTGANSGDVCWNIWTDVVNPVAPPGAPGLEGVSNYILYGSDKCSLLNKLVVTIIVTEPITATLGYTFQLNANTPTSFKNYQTCSWQQCGFEVDPTGQLTCWVNNYTASNGPSSNTGDGAPFILGQLGAPTIPAGYRLTITLQYDSDLNVTGANFLVVDNNGKPSTYTIVFTTLPLMATGKTGKVTEEYLGPNAAFQLDIVGLEPNAPTDPNGADANFTSGAGTIVYSAADTLLVANAIPSCANQTTTGERSNMLYNSMSATGGKTLSQIFHIASGPSKDGG